MLLNNITPQIPATMPSTASNLPSRPHLRVYTGGRSPLFHPAPRLHSQLEVVRTAPLLLNPPPARRAISQDVDVGRHTHQSPTPPPRTRPGHKRKISEKLKTIFHLRQTSEPAVEPKLPPANDVFVPAMARATHRRNESAPSTRVAQWVQQQSAEVSRNPIRPRRSPGTADFVVSSLATEFTFPRYNSHAASTPDLHPDAQESYDPPDEDELIEPITAALYPNGKGLLGTTQRRNRVKLDHDQDDHEDQSGMFRFDDPRPPAYSEHDLKCGDGSETSEDHFSDFAQWYVAPK